jgi:FecR protein
MPVRILFLATLAAVIAPGQSIVSARSGVINFAEGDVFLADAAIEQKAGKFPEIREGSELRTQAGRAEVLLTPGMVLRIGPDSSIRMVSGSLIDTRVEFRHGSAVIDISEDPAGTVARITYRDYELRFPKRGSFRLDSMPREFRVDNGEAEVAYVNKKRTLTKGQMVSLYGGLEAESVHRSLTDGLDEWSMRRNQQIAADNPPPGDLNGDYDPALALTPNPFYGLSSYTSPLAIPRTGIYSPGYGYIPSFNTYGSYGYGSYGSYQPYGSYGIHQPYPVYPHMPYRPIYSPPAHPPVLGGSRPIAGRPVAPPHPIVRGRGR